jgi:hypothetical protein
MKKLLMLAGLAVVLMIAGGMASAQTKTRVKFPAGTHGTSVKGTVRGYAYHDYVVGASAGQKMTVSISASAMSTVFTIFNPDGTNLEEGAETDGFVGELPASGDYVVRVLMMRNEARRKGSISNYAIKITIR